MIGLQPICIGLYGSESWAMRNQDENNSFTVIKFATEDRKDFKAEQNKKRLGPRPTLG